jgi:hypothetical protein
MVRRRRHPEVRIRSSPSYPRSGGVPSASGGRGRVSGGSSQIFSVLVIVGVVSGQSFLIYGCHHWRWLLF